MRQEPLSGIMVLSDMDGTLVRPDQTIDSCNLETIRLFTMLGGKFSVASGRTPASIEIFPQLTELLSPGITGGGTIIYDFQNKKPIEIFPLPAAVSTKALSDILEEFPDLGISIIGDDLRIYQMNYSYNLHKLFDDEKSTYFYRPQEDLPVIWAKVLFAQTKEYLEKVKEFINERDYHGVYFVSTGDNYLEMMPQGVSKGTTMYSLCNIVNVPVENVHMIGDYYNDVEIMKQAGYSVAMQNAPDDIKEFVDEVTASNEESGVGQFLYRLIQKYTT